MKKIYVLWVAFIVLIILTMPALGKTIKIGLMAPLTGSFASEGQDMQRIINLLEEETNKAGGVNGDMVEILVEDDGSTPRTAANAANKLVANGVSFVIGTYGSVVTEASQDIYDEANVVQIATGSTSIRLTSKGFSHFFRTCPRNDDQGKAAFSVLVKQGFKKVALLHDNSAYAKGLAEEVKKKIEKDNALEIIFYDALQPNESDYSTLLTKIKNTSPDVIMFTGYYQEAGMLLRQMAEMKWKIPLISGDAANNIDLIKIAGKEAAEGYQFISPPMPKDLSSPKVKKIIEAYNKRYGTNPSSIWSVVAGDAYLVLVQAIKEKGQNPDAVADFLHNDLKDFDGLTGKISFDAKGDRVGDIYRLYRVDSSGEFILQRE